jgi:DNA-binding transcriptional ArsR family regulator
LTTDVVKSRLLVVDAVAVLEDPAASAAALDPLRARLLHRLAEAPASAAGLAEALGLPRQKLRYHLKALEDRGLVVEVEQRRHGGLVERLYAPTAASFVVSPAALGPAGADPAQVPDRLSAAYLLAVAGRAIREVGALARGARRAGRPVPTLTLDAEIRFASAEARAAFAAELTDTVVRLAAAYHDDGAADGRTYRLVALAHPRPEEGAP